MATAAEGGTRAGVRSNSDDVVASAEYLCNGGHRGGRGAKGVGRGWCAFVTAWGTVHVTSFQ